MSLEDNFNYIKEKYNFKSLSDIIQELQQNCDFEHLLKDWDIIYYKYNTNYERLKELNNNYHKGYYNLQYQRRETDKSKKIYSKKKKTK